MPNPAEHPSLNALARDAWEANAAAWDERMQSDGNDFQRLLVGPAAERLLGVQPGQRVLDIACGNGVFSRHLARLGAQVVACDFSPEQIAHARARTLEHVDRVDYRVVDATDPAQLLALGESSFDSAVCNMALMDMAEIGPLFNAMPRLLKPGGCFVVTLMHPCFNGSGTTFLAEWEDRDGTPVTTLSVKVSRYLAQPPARGLAVNGQPVPHYYFHRPLHVLLGAAFAAGFVLDGLEEPAFAAAPPDSHRLLSWDHYPEIPPVLACRLRVLPKT
jgi:2-polyprenyl-3-methyl-5-hydroxy-6-metoxy-1,4-benzoquinol methylase